MKVVNGLSEILKRGCKQRHDARALLERAASEGAAGFSKVRPGGSDINRILDTIWGVGHETDLGIILGGWTLNGF